MRRQVPLSIDCKGLAFEIKCNWATIRFWRPSARPIPHRRGKIMSLASGVWGLASVVGPTLGAAVVTHLNWRWIFYESAPGMATGTYQYARTLGGTVGVGVCGGLVTGRIATTVAGVADGGGGIGQDRLLQQIADNPKVLLKPDIAQMLPEFALTALREIDPSLYLHPSESRDIISMSGISGNLISLVKKWVAPAFMAAVI